MSSLPLHCYDPINDGNNKATEDITAIKQSLSTLTFEKKYCSVSINALFKKEAQLCFFFLFNIVEKKTRTLSSWKIKTMT